MASPFVAFVLSACSGSGRDVSQPAPDFVGVVVCAECHPSETEAWRGSDHDRAMQEATEEAVLGDFDRAKFRYAGVTSTFFRRDGRFFVRTDGPDGQLADFEIAYTFGVDPLQQYLIPFPDGRLQALGIAWDTRMAEQGGQRWFHVYSGEMIDYRDPLHWTSDLQTWNHQCAECHSTGLEKNYNLGTDRYATTWREIDVACEACHGPGSRHVAWGRTYGGAARPEGGESAPEGGDRAAREFPGDSGARGFPVVFRERRGVQWIPNSGTGIARRSRPPGRRFEVEACARCHSLRAPIREEYIWGRPLLDTHRPDLLREDLYFPDGQILEEVYEYGSFLQSRMYRVGVTCSDCHEPHSLELRAEGNAACATCHDPGRFDVPDHHFHPPGSESGRCVACHMQARAYMGVDSRRDHSIRVPRPDLSERLGTPNACSSCHEDRSNGWAAAVLERWYGPPDNEGQHFGEAFHADGQGLPGAAEALVRVAADSAAAGIVRASALERLGRFPETVPPFLVMEALAHADPLARLGALRAIRALEPEERLVLAGPALGDSVLGVRQEAVRVLATVSDQAFPTALGKAFDRAAAEYVAGLMVDADRPEAHLELAAFRAARGDLGGAEAAARTALRLDSLYVPAYLGLVEIYRLQGRREKAEALLRRVPR